MGSSEQTVARQQTAEAEMEAAMAAYEQPLLRYAAAILPNPHAAQDAVQHAFIKLCGLGFPIPLEPAALRAWLYRATHNAALDQVRAEKRRAALHENAARQAAPADPAPDPDRRALVFRSLAHLNADERQVVVLRLQEHLPYKTIATATGLPTGTVGRLLHHAVRKLAALVRAVPEGAP